jgi:two-component system, NtrC family, nitrogen regulation sensor histidine kinase NtrY
MTTSSDSTPPPAAAFDDPNQPLPETKPMAFWIGLPITVLSLVSGLATYLILTGLTPIAPRNSVVIWVLLINAILIIAMIAIVAWQVRDLWQAWREKVPGARLHIRIVALFSVIAALPAILLAAGATTTFSRTFDSVSSRTKQIVENSLDVANAYLEEHGQVIRTDIVNMAKDLDDAAPLVAGNDAQLKQLVIAQAGLRELPVAFLIDAAGTPVIAAVDNDKLPYNTVPADIIQLAEAGQVPLSTPNETYRVNAVVKLQNYPGRYLYVARGVSPKVIGQMRRTQAAFAEYVETRKRRGELKFAHGLIYATFALTAVLAAIWAGLWFAGRFVAPIRRLIGAAQQVSRGNLQVELPIKRGEGDLRRLSMTFNTMTSEIKSQRDALVTANEQLTERRVFMEAVLTGVSAGVLGLDADGRITLANRSAEQLLGHERASLVGRSLREVLPQFASLLLKPTDQHLRARAQHEVTLDVKGEERTFAVRVTREQAGGASPNTDEGAVVTFDDITELVSAQRTSAWADVARRIAHEIKNPLTPIILSAERLRRKYGRVITEDRETFDKLTETIERQAGDIKTMVDEFAAFARVPKPVMEPNDLREAVQEPVILFRESHTAINYILDLPANRVKALFDRRLISQAVTNLVKNATEAVESAAEDAEAGWKGCVETRLIIRDGSASIEVIDNGIGLPKQNRARLLEPYVTNKGHKGTGLGLAIVQKIVEQHGAVLVLEDAPPGPGRTRGALVRITLPLQNVTGQKIAAE